MANKKTTIGSILVLLLTFFTVSGVEAGQIQTSDPLVSSELSDSGSQFEIKSALLKIAKTVNIPAEHPGVLKELLIEEGQFVKRGQLIGRIKDDDLVLQVKRSTQQLEIANQLSENDVDIRFAEKSRDVAIADVKRSEGMNERVHNSVPLSRLEKQRLERDRNILQLEQASRDFRIAKLKSVLAKTELQLAEQALARTKVYSPVDGMVMALERQQGEWIEPGQTIAKISSVGRLRIEGFVSAGQASRMERGLPVTVRFAQSWIEREYDGKVLFISPEANPVNLQVAVWVEIDNVDQKLIPGMRGDILVNLKQAPSRN